MPDTGAEPVPELKPEAVSEGTRAKPKRVRVSTRMHNKLRPRLFYASTSYIEQLRTVHFALLSVSAGLLLLSLTAKSYDPQKAAVQLEDIISLKAAWTARNLPALLQKPTQHDNNLTGPTESLGDLHSIRIITKAGQKPQLIPIDFVPHSDMVWIEHPIGPFPNNLREFAQWWKELGKTSHTWTSRSAIWAVRKCYISHADSCEITQNKPANDVDVRQITLDPRWGVNPSSLLRFIGIELDVEVAGYFQYSVSQADVIKRLPPGTSAGDFGTSFPDLYEATKGVLESSELEDVLKHLYADSGSSEVFEVFGLKIPAGQVASFGTVVILCVQLYLLLYLRGLKKPLEPSDAAWDVGWFAANEAPFPRSIFFVTVLILPVTTVILLAIHTMNQRLKQTSFHWNWRFVASNQFLAFMHEFPAVPFIILGCCLTLILGYLNWSNRPRIRTETANSRSQLFE
jgi:hypothetical protein